MNFFSLVKNERRIVKAPKGLLYTSVLQIGLMAESKTKLKVLKKALDKPFKLTREKKKLNKTGFKTNSYQSTQNSTQLNEQLKNGSYFNQKDQFNQPNQFNQQNRQNNLTKFQSKKLKNEKNKTNQISIDQMTKSNEINLISTHQMEDLNGILNDQNKNMHLLSDKLNDSLISSKRIECKEKNVLDIYNLNSSFDLENQFDNLGDLNDLNGLDQSNSFNQLNSNQNLQNYSPTENLIQFNQINNQQNLYLNSSFSVSVNQQPALDLLDQNPKNLTANQMTNLNKQNRTKKIKNVNSQPKKKTPKIKFHEYKGPQANLQKHSKDQLDSGLDKLKEQQNTLQKQLISQLNNANTTKAVKPSQTNVNNLQAKNFSNNPNIHLNETNSLKINVCPNEQENLNAFSLNASIQANSEFQSNSPKDSQLKDETSANNLLNQNDAFRYSPTLNENQQFKGPNNQFNLSSSQLTPPYQQQSTKPVGTKQTADNLTPLNELNIEKLEEMKVQDLKLYLKKYNLPVSGPKKLSLVRRLKDFILNNKPIDINQTGLNNFQTNLQQLTPPNTPMALDQLNNEQNSDSDDGKFVNTNSTINSSNCLFNGTKIFVNNSHFPASIPINPIPYTIQQNSIQFQNSQNTANNPTNSFTLPLTNIPQAQQIHFLSNPIITNSNASQQQINQQISNQLSQQLNTSLTVHHQQLTSIPQAISCAQNASIPTIVTTSQITPILLYSRNTIPNSTSINQQTNQQACSDMIAESNSPVKPSVKSSIRKNILLKQKKQEELRQLQLSQQQNKQLKANIEAKENYSLENCNDQLINNQEIFANKIDTTQQNFFENKIEEKNDFELDTNSNVFELLMEVEEINDFIKDSNKDNKENDDLNTEKLDYLKAKEDYSNKTNHLSQINANEIGRIDQTRRIEELGELEKSQTKANLEFNDFSNIDSILNYEMDDTDYLNTEDNLADWLIDQENNLINSSNVNTHDVNTSLENTKQDNSKTNHKEFSFSNFRNDENLNFLYDLTEPQAKFESPKNESNNQGYFYSSSSYSKQQNFFETTNCNLMDPVLPNYYTDQQSSHNFTEGLGNDFKSTSFGNNCEIDMNYDKNNFTAY